MGGLLRAAAVSVIGYVAAYAMKRMMASVQKQADAAREQAEKTQNTADMKQAKQLKQDPVTGVYYAED
jgi:Sec-independent protein translocase protein TatA